VSFRERTWTLAHAVDLDIIKVAVARCADLSRGVEHSGRAVLCHANNPVMMMPRKLQSGPFAERARRSVREIAIAVALTLAAVVFVISAIHGRAPETASISAPQGALENPSN
jgi:hypothetical protein